MHCFLVLNFGPLLVCESQDLDRVGGGSVFLVAFQKQTASENIWNCRVANNVAGSSVNFCISVDRFFCFVVRPQP